MEDTIAKKKAEQRRSRLLENLVAVAMISPYVIIFIIFSLIPTVLGFVMSFMKYNPYDTASNTFVGFENYLLVFNFTHPISKLFWESFLTMFLFAAIAVPALIVIPLALAYFVNMQPPGYKLFRAILYLPSVVSITIVGIIFANMFAGDSSGIINAWFGTTIQWLSGKPWQGDTLRWVIMFIASIWWQTGTNFVIFSGALRDVPKSLYEACEMDGGGRMHRIFFVTIPNIRSGIGICTFNTLIAYLGLYGQPYVMSTIENENIFVSPMMFIQHYLMGGTTFAKQTGYLCACAIVFGLIVMTFGIIQRAAMSDKRKRGTINAECKRYFINKGLAAEEEGGAAND